MTREQFLAQLIREIERVKFFLSHPRENPWQFLLVVGLMITFVVLILTVLASFFVEPTKEKVTEEKVSPRPRLSPLMVFAYFLIIFFLLLISGSIYTSSPSFCSTCHVMKKDYQAWRKSSHRQVNCLSCHGEPGAIGFFVEKAQLVEEAIAYITGSYQKPITSRVSDALCYRCHQEIKRKTVVSRVVRVKHQHFLGANYKCADCHNTIAHGGAVPMGKYPSMDKCTICHDNKKASGKCKLCHVKKKIEKVTEIKDYPKVQLVTRLKAPCQGCHGDVPCAKCHGSLPLPHPAKLAHEMVARRGCYRCHDRVLCSFCHRKPSLSPIPGPPLK